MSNEDSNEVSVIQMEVDDPNFPFRFMMNSSILNLLRDQKTSELVQVVN